MSKRSLVSLELSTEVNKKESKQLKKDSPEWLVKIDANHLPIEYDEICRVNDIPVMQVTSDSINKILASILRQPDIANKNSYIEIKDNEFKVDARPNTKYGKKQLRHVTPYSFVTDYIKDSYKLDSKNKCDIEATKESLKILVSFVICHSEKGYVYNPALAEIEKLAQKERGIIEKAFANDNARAMSTKNKLVFRSPEAFSKYRELSDSFKEIQKKMKLNFLKEFLLFFDEVIGKLFIEIKDSNTQKIAISIFASSILVAFNKKQNSVFPDEGHTVNASYVYDKKKIGTYELKIKQQSSDLDTQKLQIDTHFESNMVKKSKQALKFLGDLFFSLADLSQTEEVKQKQDSLIKNYNDKHNEVIVFSNIILPKEKVFYIEKLSFDRASIAVHIAKHMFFCFDYKALENYVLLSYDKDMGLKYEALLDNKYAFYSGSEYREHMRDKMKEKSKLSKIAIFREEDINIINLAEIALEHFILSSLLSSSHFMAGFVQEIKDQEKKNNDILNYFADLLSIDYQLNDHDNQLLHKTMQANFSNLVDLVGGLPLSLLILMTGLDFNCM